MPKSIVLLVENLTEREDDVLQQLALGHTNPEIAITLFITEATVKTHLAAIFQKLSVGNRTEAVVVGSQLGLIDSENKLSPIATAIATLIMAYPDDYAQVCASGILGEN